MKFTGSQIGKQAAAKSKGLFSADDWMCSKYDFVDNVTHATTLDLFRFVIVSITIIIVK